MTTQNARLLFWGGWKALARVQKEEIDCTRYEEANAEEDGNELVQAAKGFV